MFYQIRDGNSVASVYCRMSSIDRCSGGGWTMVMKIDGTSVNMIYYADIAY